MSRRAGAGACANEPRRNGLSPSDGVLFMPPSGQKARTPRLLMCALQRAAVCRGSRSQRAECLRVSPRLTSRVQPLYSIRMQRSLRCASM